MYTYTRINSCRASVFFFMQVMWLAICTAIVGYVPDGPFKRWLNQRVLIMDFDLLSSALSSVIIYHNPENRPKSGICVANHTSPIDVLVLMCDNCYSLVRSWLFLWLSLSLSSLLNFISLGEKKHLFRLKVWKISFQKLC